MKRGFTIVELMTTILIVGILSTIGLVGYNSAMQRSRDNQRKADLNSLKNALEQYYVDNRQYPYVDGGDINNTIPTADFQLGSWDNVNSNSCTRDITTSKTLVPKYISKIPEDPKFKAPTDFPPSVTCTISSINGLYLYLSKPYDSFHYSGGGTTESKATGYYLGAKMERSNDTSILTVPDATYNGIKAARNIKIVNATDDTATHNYFIQSGKND